MKWLKKTKEEDIFTRGAYIQEPPSVYEPTSSIEMPEDIHSKNFFGKLQPFIDDLEITDINCNSHSTWVR